MEVLSIALARSIALFDIGELNPKGNASISNLIPVIVDRFAFKSFPVKPEDFQDKDGIEFKNGFFEGQLIANMTLYNDGIKVDVHSSTEEGQAVLRGTLEWLAKEVGLNYSEKMLSRWAFLSQITYHSDIDIDVVNPALQAVGEEVSHLVNERTRLATQFRVNQIFLNFDRTYHDAPLAPFSIERRAKTPYEEGKYFSAAPLQTRDHIRILEQFEHALGPSHESRKGTIRRVAEAAHRG